MTDLPSRRRRAAVVDDEPLALQVLATMLEDNHGFEVVSYREPAAAIRELAQTRYDVVFLDVKMPEVDGFELLRRLPREALPEVVFVTAHNEYALKAFECAALDYLLKPFDASRLSATVARLVGRLEDRRLRVDADRLVEVLEALSRERRVPQHLPAWAPGEQRAILIPLQAVHWIQAQRKALIVHTAEGAFRLRGPLRDLDEQLAPSSFLRINRSAVVNVAYVREVQRWFRGDFLVVLKSGERLTSSLAFRDGLEKLLGLSRKDR